jgi:hypothetical protein
MCSVAPSSVVKTRSSRFGDLTAWSYERCAYSSGICRSLARWAMRKGTVMFSTTPPRLTSAANFQLPSRRPGPHRATRAAEGPPARAWSGRCGTVAVGFGGFETVGVADPPAHDSRSLVSIRSKRPIPRSELALVGAGRIYRDANPRPLPCHGSGHRLTLGMCEPYGQVSRSLVRRSWLPPWGHASTEIGT